MDKIEQRDLLLLLKTVADESRLIMVGLMSEREYTVTEMAQWLKLTEPTVSHHVGKMHSAGLLNLRMAGNQRFYRINETRLTKFKDYIADITSLPAPPAEPAADDAWIEQLDWDEADKKVLRDYTANGRLTQIPSKVKKWLVVLRWLSSKFAPDIRYTEKQVNAILTEYHPDYATIRRDLVELGFMRRERGGGNYWLVPDDQADRENVVSA